MAIINRRAVLILSALLALAAIMLATAPVLARGGDYGVATGRFKLRRPPANLPAP